MYTCLEMPLELRDVETHKIFSEQELDSLREELDVFPMAPFNEAGFITNSFHLWARPKIKEWFGNKLCQKTYEITNSKWYCQDLFFLEYHASAEARLHRDQHAIEGGVSIVTLLNAENLIGGNILIEQDQQTVVIHQEIGDSTFYKADVIHGVSKIEQGYRTVLVAWLTPKQDGI